MKINRNKNLHDTQLAPKHLIRNYQIFILAAITLLCAVGRGVQAQGNTFWLENLDLNAVQQDWGSAQAGRSAESHPLTLKGMVYPHGVGTHANGSMTIDLHRAALRFVATVGVDDDAAAEGAVKFKVIVDGKNAAETPVLHAGDTPSSIDVDLAGANRMTLLVLQGGTSISNDHADWADARIVLVPDTLVKPEMLKIAATPARMVAIKHDPTPQIHGPTVVGATPGRPFLFRIPATGDGPLVYAAKNLPNGLTLGPKTGIITGALTRSATTAVSLTVSGPHGVARRVLTIIGGDHKLAQTPPMGWNSWNVWAGAVDAAKVKAAADAMVTSGLAAHGFAYINIDDTWEAKRDTNGVIQTNDRFPDMTGLADYVHAKGLKLGIYSSPGPTTCGNFTGSYGHEAQDAQSYAKWGVDYLKYDWCSYGNIAKDGTLSELRKPYQGMADALNSVNRDIVYSFCQYGMGNVWEWGAADGGNCWRTTGDINDSWNSLRGIFEQQNGHEKYAGPGHWNDPDMLVVGSVGWGRPHPSKLTPNEQLLHISLWCLLSSPLLIGCDMSRMDPFTVELLSNDELLDIDQDPLGKPAGRVSRDGDNEVWARTLADGSHAAGLVNNGMDTATVTVTWSDLGIKGKQPVRDLWLHKNVGTFNNSYSVEVPPHGIVVVKIGKD